MPALRSILLFLALLFGAALVMSAPAHAAAGSNCRVISASLQQSIDAGDLDGAAATFNQQLKSNVAGCPQQETYCEGQNLARAYADAARAIGTTGTIAEMRALLEKGQKFGSPWDLLLARADVAFADAQSRNNQDAYREAALYYQLAVDALNEDRQVGDKTYATTLCSEFGEVDPPDAETIRKIDTNMGEAVMLSGRVDTMEHLTRDNTCGGAFAPIVRSFKATYRPLPIYFGFDLASLDDDGARTAGVLLACAKQNHYTSLTLSGHTDNSGDADYNMDLSQRRLDTIAQYLIRGGYTGQLRLIAKGETQPFVPYNADQFSHEQLQQLNRRVVIEESTVAATYTQGNAQ